MTEPADLLISIDAQPAWAAGHFPNDPILPGAKLLDLVVQALHRAGVLEDTACEIAQTKFTAPVRPGDKVRLSWTNTASRMRYVCEVGTSVVASGQITTKPLLPRAASR